MQDAEDRVPEFLDKEIIENCIEALDGIHSDSIDLIYSDLPHHEKTIHCDDDQRDLNVPPGIEYCAKLQELANSLYRISRGYCALHLGLYDDNNKLAALVLSLKKAGFIPSESCIIEQRKDGYRSNLVICCKWEPIIKLNKTVWDLRSMNYSNTFRGIHSAITWSEIAKVLIETFTDEGGIVFDPFIGTSSTTYVAKKLNRHFLGLN